MGQFVVHGGHELQGKIKVNGAKNAALPIFIATLIAPGEYILHNVPDLRDIKIISKLLEELGLEVEKIGDHDYKIINNGIKSIEAPYELVKEMRASFLVMGPLLAHKGHAKVALPGGCAIGSRPVDFHLTGFEALGTTVTLEHGYVETRADELIGTTIELPFPSVGATENILMAAMGATGKTILKNAAKEPEIADLCRFLESMGAHIDGIGTDEITLEVTEELHACEHTIIPDRIEAGTFIVLSALTGGRIEIEGVNLDHLTGFTTALTHMGVDVTEDAGIVRVAVADQLKAIDISTEPYPGFPTDLQAQTMVLMTQAQGRSSLTETIFENRFMHVDELKRMGAHIELDGNKAVITGPITFSGAEVRATDLRAGASMVLAGLIADNSTRINDIYHVQRGYEQLPERLIALGATIERVD